MAKITGCPYHSIGFVSATCAACSDLERKALQEQVHELTAEVARLQQESEDRAKALAEAEKKSGKKAEKPRLKQYAVEAEMTITVFTLVWAYSKTEAIQIAKNRDIIELCAHCAGGNDSREWVTTGSLDGTPFDFVATPE